MVHCVTSRYEILLHYFYKNAPLTVSYLAPYAALTPYVAWDEKEAFLIEKESIFIADYKTAFI